jgi:hypothetical protein
MLPRKRGLGNSGPRPNGKAAHFKCSRLLRLTWGVMGSRLPGFCLQMSFFPSGIAGFQRSHPAIRASRLAFVSAAVWLPSLRYVHLERAHCNSARPSGFPEPMSSPAKTKTAYKGRSADRSWRPVSSWTSIKSFGQPEAFLFRTSASNPMNLNFL